MPFSCVATSCKFVQSLGAGGAGVVCGPINDVLVIEFLPSYAYSHLRSILMYLTIIKTLGLWSLRSLIIISWNLEAEHRFRKHLWSTYHVANNWQCLSLPSPLPPPFDLPSPTQPWVSVCSASSAQSDTTCIRRSTWERSKFSYFSMNTGEKFPHMELIDPDWKCKML